MDVVDLNGQGLQLGAPRNDGLSTLILFLSPTCPVCESLLPVLQASRKQERNWLQIVLASDGDPAAHREFVRSHALLEFPYVVSAPLGMTTRSAGCRSRRSWTPRARCARAAGQLPGAPRESVRGQRLGVASLQEYFVAHG